MSDAQTRPDDIVSLITTGRCRNRKDGAQLPALSARSAYRVAIKVFGSASHPRRRACLASSPDGKPPQACSGFSSCPVFRQSASVTPGKLGSGWSRAVVVAGNFELFEQIMTGRACASSRFQRRVSCRRSMRRCPRADAG